uniref:Leucine-rich repeat-containing N-terminal plant-type domain-containing protein n=1 Tax=Neobodo designis TaxID=312471 RepID=A0A7S1LZM3_NEODS|mmetsp:Transcript_31445/g.97139  ORF Transcript_31445/g.97139 Transcript_31445/m.97139 type:complete len:380 (+) Transcript_31445:105-1244(+)
MRPWGTIPWSIVVASAVAVLGAIASTPNSNAAMESATSQRMCGTIPGVAVTGPIVMKNTSVPNAQACCYYCWSTQNCSVATLSDGFCLGMSSVTSFVTGVDGAASFSVGGTSHDDVLALASLAAGIIPTPPTWGSATPVCSWKGVTCSQTGMVTDVTLHFDAPLTGTVDLTQLPDNLRQLDLSANNFHGEVDLTLLPSQLTWLDLNGNHFNGTVNLTQLPTTLQYLDLDTNDFSGTVDLAHLPNALNWLDLHHNNFGGTVDLMKLPPKLSYLSLSINGIGGRVVLTQLPSQLQSLDLRSNHFNGTVDLTQLPSQMQLLTLSANDLSGTADLSHLPSTLQFVDLSDNHFCGSMPTNVGCSVIALGSRCQCAGRTVKCPAC